jgi:hypothetical protein
MQTNAGAQTAPFIVRATEESHLIPTPAVVKQYDGSLKLHLAH